MYEHTYISSRCQIVDIVVLEYMIHLYYTYTYAMSYAIYICFMCTGLMPLQDRMEHRPQTETFLPGRSHAIHWYLPFKIILIQFCLASSEACRVSL